MSDPVAPAVGLGVEARVEFDIDCPSIAPPHFVLEVQDSSTTSIVPGF